jgi:hypothetical protein
MKHNKRGPVPLKTHELQTIEYWVLYIESSHKLNINNIIINYCTKIATMKISNRKTCSIQKGAVIWKMISFRKILSKKRQGIRFSKSNLKILCSKLKIKK